MRAPKKPLSAWIVAQREAQGWKSEELAQHLGVSGSTVRGWEAGRSVSLPNLTQLERLFGVTAPGHDEPAGDLTAVLAIQNAYLARITVALEKLAGIDPDDPPQERLSPGDSTPLRAARDAAPTRLRVDHPEGAAK